MFSVEVWNFFDLLHANMLLLSTQKFEHFHCAEGGAAEEASTVANGNDNKRLTKCRMSPQEKKHGTDGNAMNMR